MERDARGITVRATVLVNGEWLERNYFFREMPDKELCGDLFQDLIESALKYSEVDEGEIREALGTIKR